MATKKDKDKDKEQDLFAALAKTTGGEILADTDKVPYFIDTGSLSLNYICSGKMIGGGLPGGKITEAYGPPGSAKSLLGYCLLAGCQKMGGISIYLDCERATNADFAATAGHVDTKKLLIYYPVTIEQVEKKIIAVTKAIRKHKGNDAPICFVWDSIGVTPTEREWSEIELPENHTDADFNKIVGSREKPGERARAAGDALRTLNPFLDEYNATLFIINQIRSKLNVKFGSPDTGAGGGRALEFYASCRLRTSARKSIVHTKRKIPLGVNLCFNNKKNRAFTPHLFCENIRLYYSCGIDPLGGLLDTLIMAGRIVKVEGARGKYKVLSPWNNGEDVTFTSSKARNDVPLEVLCKYPGLIDATSAEQITSYMAEFKIATELTDSDDMSEGDAKDEDADIIEDSDLLIDNE